MSKHSNVQPSGSAPLDDVQTSESVPLDGKSQRHPVMSPKGEAIP